MYEQFSVLKSPDEGLRVRSWSVGSNLAQGCSLWQLWRYVHRHLDWRACVTDPQCAVRFTALVVTSALNTVLGLLETIYLKLAGVDIDAIALPDDVVFVIGVPRSGTTLLHSVLAVDEQFATPKTLDVAFPNSNILLRRWCPGWLLRLIGLTIPSTRPMDSLPLSLETVQEDEIATNVLSGGRSPYACLSFMSDYERLLKYTTFEEVPVEEFEEWLVAFRRFLKRLVFVNGPAKRLLLKSPVHTGRTDLLRKIFPTCRFVHVHRDPSDVIRSSLHMASCYYPSCFLQPTTAEHIVNFTFQQWKLLYRALFSSKTYMGDSQMFIEVSFDELDSSRGTVADVVSVLARIYARLELGNVPTRAIEAFLHDLLIVRQFQKNDHAQTLRGKFDETRLQARIDREAAFVYQRYQYDNRTIGQ